MPYIGAPDGLQDDTGGPLFSPDRGPPDAGKNEKDLQELAEELNSELLENLRPE